MPEQPELPKTIKIIVKTVNGGAKTLFCFPNTTGAELKKIIYD